MQARRVAGFIILEALVALGVAGAWGQKPANTPNNEQRAFDGEPDRSAKQVRRPAEIPESALNALRDTLTGGVGICIRSRGATPEHAPASWFLASEIHLGGPDEVDYIVVPNGEAAGGPTDPGGCLLPAHGGWFWILGPGPTSGRYGLFLAVYGYRLEILSSRTNRYKDVQVDEGLRTLLYKFTVQQYQLAGQKALHSGT